MARTGLLEVLERPRCPAARVYAYFLYCFVVFVVDVFLMAEFVRRTPDHLEKRLIRMLLWATAISQAAGLVAEGLVMNFGFPHLSHLTPLIWSVALVYMVAKFRLFVLTPMSAARKILATMSNFVFLVDTNGRISYCNPSACRLTGVSPEQLDFALGHTSSIRPSS